MIVSAQFRWPRRLALAALIGIMASIQPPAQAFDIPTPANQPKAITPPEPPKDPGPITPLLPTADLVSEAGAGQLPEGVSVTTTVTPPPAGILLRAPFLVTLTILDKARSLADYGLHRPHGDAFVTRRISIDQKLVTLDGRLVNRYVYRFAVTPLQPGPAVLSFAEMTFRTVGDSQTRYAFMPVARNLTIRPLPAFWPEYLPVAPDLVIQATPLPELTSGQPVDWHLKVTGEGLTEQALLKILGEQLISPTGLRLGEPEIRLATDAPIPSDDPLAETFSIRIPLLPDPAGQDAIGARLPELRLPFIDSRATEPGQALSYSVLPAQAIHWTPPMRAQVAQMARYWWWRILLILAILYAAGHGVRDLSRRLSVRRRRRHAQARLAQAPDPHTLLVDLRQITGLPTLRQMIDAAPNPRFMAALRTLDRLCYRTTVIEEGETEFLSVRSELLRWLPRIFFNDRPARPQ